MKTRMTILFLCTVLMMAGVWSAAAQGRDAYAVRYGRVYFENNEIRGADARSFRDLGYGYGKDRYHVYMYGRVLPYVDPSSFRVSRRYEPDYVPGNPHTGPGNGNHPGPGNGNHPNTGPGNGDRPGNAGPGYGSPGGGRPDESGYRVTTHEVFYNGRKISGASANSFRDLGYGYGKDSFSVFYCGKELRDAMASTFKVLGWGYAKDSFNVYYGGKVLKDAMASTFRVLDNGYAEDAFNTWYRGSKTR